MPGRRIRYPRAIWDDQLRAWISDAEVAEIAYTAFTSKKGQAVTARLIVRRVRDLAKTAEGQGELFPAWRYHPVFTDSPFQLAPAEEQHRDHAVVEQVFADWTNGPLAHLPSGSFTANAAWLTCAAITCNLLRAAGCLASRFHARARGATIRADLIDVAARLAAPSSVRSVTRTSTVPVPSGPTSTWSLASPPVGRAGGLRGPRRLPPQRPSAFRLVPRAGQPCRC